MPDLIGYSNFLIILPYGKNQSKNDLEILLLMPKATCLYPGKRLKAFKLLSIRSPNFANIYLRMVLLMFFQKDFVKMTIILVDNVLLEDVVTIPKYVLVI